MAEWLLVDGSSLIFRAFFGVPKTFRAPDGRLVNAVRGFSDRLATLVQERRPHRIAVATDEDWRPRWRVDLIPGYKAHRVAEPIPPELEPQMPLIMGYLEAAGVDVVGVAGYEAEDVIASLVARIDDEVEIVSGDRDLFALVRGSRVRVLYPEKNGLAVVDEAEVERRYGIPGRAYGDFAVLRGDPSDGLPGVAGVGPKKAADLLKRHGSVTGMIAAGVFGAADREYLTRALRVVPPVETLDIPIPEGRRSEYPADPDLFEAIVNALGLRSVGDRILRALKLLQ